MRLIVNADDYGRTPGVSLGIRLAHLQGIVTSTSAMMNMPAAEEGLRQAQSECPRLGLGVHLVLTSGRPLSAAEKVPSLVTAGGRFAQVEEATDRLLGLERGGVGLNLEEVELEWRAQIEKFRAVTGQAPDHLDSHHHFSYFSPGLFRLMLRLAEEYGAPIRNLFTQSPAEVKGRFPDELGDIPLEQFARLLQEFHPRCPDRFSADFYDENVRLDLLLEVIDSLPQGVTELMCHPAVPDAALMDPLTGSVYNLRRAEELALLTSPQVRAGLNQRGVELINFGNL